MLLLVFQIGEDRFALDAGRIVEVLPLLNVKPMIAAPAGIKGSFNYRGRFVPVVDLGHRLLGRPAAERLSTRIVLVSLLAEGDGLVVGLIVDNATDIIRCNPSDFLAPPLVSDDAPYLGAMVEDSRGLVQLVDLDTLLSGSLRRSLGSSPAEAA